MLPSTIAILNLCKGVKKAGSGFAAFCAAHGDEHRSLTIGEADDRTLINCKAGCPPEKVMAALGMTLSDLFEHKPENVMARDGARETIYAIKDHLGVLIAEHGRWDAVEGKRLAWRLPGGEWKHGLRGLKLADLPLYNIDRLIRNHPGADGMAVVTEGEKCSDSLWARGIPSVGTVTGASSAPSIAVLAQLVGYVPYLWPDADEPGRKHMDVIAYRLARYHGEWPLMIEFLGAAKGADAADYAGDVGELMGAAKPWNDGVLPASDKATHADGGLAPNPWGF